MDVSADTLNQTFMARLESPEGLEKMAARSQGYVRDKLRENSFARKIIPPRMVTKSELQVSVNHDTLVFIDEVEPNSRAMSMTFRGQPTVRFIKAERYEIPFFTVSSERFEKTEQELMAYRMPITKVIEQNSVKDIQAVEDYRFMVYVEAAVQATSQIVKGEQAEEDEDNNGSDTGFRGKIQRPDLIELFNELDGEYLLMKRILINSVDWNHVSAWTIEDFGDGVQGKVVVDGFNYDRIMGRLVVRTIKTDILQTGNVYGFADPEFLGKFLVLNNTKFYLDKEANLITWQAWEDIGMGIGNVAGIAKLELYNDSSDSLASEASIGTRINAQADDGITFPDVSVF